MDYSKESVTSCPAYCDRLIKLETIVDRFGDDCDKLTELHRKHLDDDNQMMVDLIKTTAEIHASITVLSAQVAPLIVKVHEHDKFMWKTSGIIIAVTAVAQLIVFMLSH